MTRYDAQIIYTFADALYLRAKMITIASTVIGAMVIGFSALLFAIASDSNRFFVTLIGLLIGGGIGYFLGSNKAFELRFQAQILLCQVAIEENTRRALAATGNGEMVGTQMTKRVESVIAPVNTSLLSKRKCHDCGAPLSRFDEFCPKCAAKVMG